MKITKKFTAIQINTNKINNTIKVDLEYGDIQGPYYAQIRPETEFNTEEEALGWAYKENEFATWLIIPIIRFNTN